MGVVIKGPPPPISPEAWARMTPAQRQHHLDMQKARAMAPRSSGYGTSNPLGYLIGASIIAGLMGCSPAPADCADHRTMTFYEHEAALGWTGVKTSEVCIVFEKRAPAPIQGHAPHA